MGLHAVWYMALLKLKLEQQYFAGCSPRRDKTRLGQLRIAESPCLLELEDEALDDADELPESDRVEVAMFACLLLGADREGIAGYLGIGCQKLAVG